MIENGSVACITNDVKRCEHLATSLGGGGGCLSCGIDGMRQKTKPKNESKNDKTLSRKKTKNLSAIDIARERMKRNGKKLSFKMYASEIIRWLKIIQKGQSSISSVR